VRQEWYKNFRRNFLGHCIDGRFYRREDRIDDLNQIHNAFDYGFICALEKIRYEIGAHFHKIEVDTRISKNLKAQIEDLIEARIKSAYCDEFNSERAQRMRQKVSENSIRIADDF